MKLAQPPIIRPTTDRPETAKKYSRPMFMSKPTRPGAKGITSSVRTIVRKVTIGAMVKTTPSAPVGVKSSLASTLKPWKTELRVPHGPITVRPDA